MGEYRSGASPLINVMRMNMNEYMNQCVLSESTQLILPIYKLI